MTLSIMINTTEYPILSCDGVLRNNQWDRRDTKAIRLAMTHEQASALFVDGLAWSLVQRDTFPVFDEDGNPTDETKEETQVFDNSDYCVAGTITDNRDGTVTCMMGRQTELEIAQAALADAETAAKILLGEAE